MSPILVVKSTGEQQAFEPAKLLSSLRKSGATKDQAEQVLLHIQREMVSGMTTSELYGHAFKILRQQHQPTAARYSMRRAIAELGPAGFPFEKFVAEIFKSEGYEAVTDQVVQGHCVEHEVDVVAWKGDELVMVECKFHNESGMKSDLKVALYVKARSEDLMGREYEFGGKVRKLSAFQLFTNTKFTDHAIRYAQCNSLPLVSWNYPMQGNLQELVADAGLHPLTSLTTLTAKEKKTLLDAGLVLCKQVALQGDNLVNYGIDKGKISDVLAEIATLCG